MRVGWCRDTEGVYRRVDGVHIVMTGQRYDRLPYTVVNGLGNTLSRVDPRGGRKVHACKYSNPLSAMAAADAAWPINRVTTVTPEELVGADTVKALLDAGFRIVRANEVHG